PQLFPLLLAGGSPTARHRSLDTIRLYRESVATKLTAGGLYAFTRSSTTPTVDEPAQTCVNSMPSRPREPFIDYIEVLHGRTQLDCPYAGDLPAIKAIRRLTMHPKVTYFIGENGSGKSTLLEAIAVADGFNAEGGTRNFNFSSRASHADLYKWIR